MTEKTCAGCKTAFETDNPYRKYCKKDCGRSSASANQARATRRADHAMTFIGVDGEGITRPDGVHEYVLLSVGSRSLYQTPTGKLRDARQLSYDEIFSFLWECFQENREACYVGFFLGYDFTQWLRTIPERAARYLLSKEGIAARTPKSGKNPRPYPVRLGRWEFDIHAGRRFRLRKYEGIRNRGSWMYICDAGPFYQTSFLAAIDPKKWETRFISDTEFAVIEAGKSARDRVVLEADMIEYNVMENEILGRLIGTLNDGLVDADIRLGSEQWYGPGQAAGAWLKLIACPKGEEIREIVPEWAVEAARCTYFGGWFEIYAHGHIPGPSYEYDINSAYPFGISTLPCLLHGTWTQGTGEPAALPSGHWRIVFAEVTGDDPIVGTMLHRTPYGRVLRPKHTKGWYWYHELQEAVTAGLISSITYSEWIDYAPCDCGPPLAAIKELYQKRLQVGKESSSGKAYKIVYNSSYGKMAQSIGNPPFANSLYASLITSLCRTQILYAIATHPKKTADLLMVATDGVYFRTPHPTLECDAQALGKWGAKILQNLTLWMPGIYWDDTTRARLLDGGSPKLKSRGVNAKALADQIAVADKQFDAMDWNSDWPTINVPINFTMITAVQALARNKWQLAGVVSRGDSRALDSDPGTKRDPTSRYREEIGRSELIWRSLPYDRSPDGLIESTPYELRFGDELKEVMSLEDITPDGRLDSLLHDAIRPGSADHWQPDVAS